MKNAYGIRKPSHAKKKYLRRFRRRMTGVILSAAVIAGAMLLAYPAVSDQWNRLHQTHAVMNYTDTVDRLEEETYRHVLEVAYDYNRKLARKGTDWNMGDEELAAYRSQLDIDASGVMGYINIPKIHVRLPICHGTDEPVLEKAVGHLEGTSLPVGCQSFSQEEGMVTDQTEGSHCALSGHRGLPSAKLFTDLDRLAEGDRFSITVLDETLTYEVDQIHVVEPADLSDLEIVPGEDYCTLITCTPYGVNTHRLLVRGHRIAQSMDDPAMKSQACRFWPDLIIAMAAVFGLSFLLIVLMVVTRKKKAAQTREQ